MAAVVDLGEDGTSGTGSPAGLLITLTLVAVIAAVVIARRHRGSAAVDAVHTADAIHTADAARGDDVTHQ